MTRDLRNVSEETLTSIQELELTLMHLDKVMGEFRNLKSCPNEMRLFYLGVSVTHYAALLKTLGGELTRDAIELRPKISPQEV